VLRVDFRGAGGSSGWASVRATHGEVEDVLASVEWLQTHMGVSAVHVVGYSTGAAVGATALDKSEAIKGLVAVGFPFGGWNGVLAIASKWALGPHFHPAEKSQKPIVFITGDRDEITSVEEMEERCRSCQEPTALHILPGAGHFDIVGRGRYIEATVRHIGVYLSSYGNGQGESSGSSVAASS